MTYGTGNLIGFGHLCNHAKNNRTVERKFNVNGCVIRDCRKNKDIRRYQRKYDQY